MSPLRQDCKASFNSRLQWHGILPGAISDKGVISGVGENSSCL